MIKRKLLALLLCLVMVISVAACGGGDDTDTEPSPSPAESTIPPSERQVDYAFAFEAYAPETVMLSIGGIDVTWELLFFFYANAIEEVVYYTNAVPDFGETEEGEYYRQQIHARAMDGLTAYKTVEYLAREAGITLSEDDIAELELSRTSDVTYYGGEEAFQEYLTGTFQTETVYAYLMSVQYLYNKLVTDNYGEAAADMPDDEALAITQSQDWLMAKHILISTRIFNDDGSYTDFNEAEKAAAQEQANDITAQLKDYSGDDFDAFFDELMNEFSGDEGGLYGYPDGYLFTSGAMMEEFEQGTRDLEIGEFSAEPVETIYGFHIIYRLPLDLDAIPTTASITLREIAARTLISEELEAAMETLTVENEPVFDSFDLAQVFTTY